MKNPRFFRYAKKSKSVAAFRAINTEMPTPILLL